MITKFIVLAIYVAMLFLIGIIASKRVKSMSDYYLGGKKMGFWAVAFSARATGESGWLLIGLTGMGAMAGYSAYWVVLGELLGVFISWQFMAKLFKRRSDKYNAITIPDYLQSHFKLILTHFLLFYRLHAITKRFYIEYPSLQTMCFLEPVRTILLMESIVLDLQCLLLLKWTPPIYISRSAVGSA